MARGAVAPAVSVLSLRNAEHETEGLQVIKRRVYLLALVVGWAVGLLKVVLYWEGTPFDQLGSPLYLLILAGATGLLWWKPRSLPAVEKGTLGASALFLLLVLIYALYGGQTEASLVTELTDFIVWTPLFYILTYLVYGSKRGLLVSALFLGVVLVVSAPQLISLGLYPRPSLAADLLGRFLIISIVHFLALYVFAYLLEKHLQARTHAEAIVKHALTDSLTGLPNRHAFHERLELALEQAQQNEEQLALLLLDLDRFKLVNDTLGHHTGDRLLQHAALRLQSCVRQSDTLARISGDEFALIIEKLSGPEDAVTVAQKLIEALRVPFHLGGQPLFASASIGISLYPAQAKSTDALRVKADQAMYAAKAQGKNTYQLSSEGASKRSMEWFDIEQRLRKAFDDRELELHYQPVFDLGSHELVGVEALLRWKHPRLGAIPPTTFIPVAEESQLIIPIGSWVLQEACRQNQAWQRAGYHPMVISVNVSPTQFAQPDFVDVVKETLQDSGLAARWLELELTESTVIHDAACERLAALREVGIRVSLDDFGTGYSSLSQLQQLPLDGLKIDRSFLARLQLPLGADGNALVLIKTIVSLARAFGLRVVAEGIETSEQLEALRDTGCDKVQGFMLGKPMSARELEGLLPHGVKSRRKHWAMRVRP
jgi:diguanylate cyclase (GGDEF)-like protein